MKSQQAAAQAEPSPLSQDAVPAPGSARADAAKQVRVDAATFQRGISLPTPTNNGDEDRHASHYANYSKGLPHDTYGDVLVNGTSDPYVTMVNAVNSGDPEQLEAIPLAGPRRLVNPQAAYAYQLEGADSHALATLPAPAFTSREAAGEMEELYWMSLSRDVAFQDYTASPPPSPLAEALQELDTHPDFRGPKANGHVTAGTLFRDTLPGSTQGPYLSQFLLLDVPYGTQRLSQRIQTRVSGDDRLFAFPEWLNIQNGQLPSAGQQERFDPTPRYIRNGRDLAEYVHRDFPLQSSLNAALIILGQNDNDTDPKSAPPVHDPNNPYLDYVKQEAFVTFGNADLLDLIGRVMKLALQGQWYQKWQVHRRLRPEEFGGRVNHQKTGGPPRYQIPSTLLNSPVFSRVFNRNKALNLQFNNVDEGYFLLNQAYPEGSPLHPAYGSGHSTYVGAGVTMLKAFFRTTRPVKNPVVPSADGLSLVPYTGPTLTLQDELDKLASNIGLGRLFAGVHYRSDHEHAVRLGELIALRVLQDLARTYNEAHHGDFPGFLVTTFGGNTLTLNPTGPSLPNAVSAIACFSLINADTDQPVAGFDPLLNGAILNRANLPPNLNIRAHASPSSSVSSVRFTYDGTSSIDNEAPYSLGSGTGGNYPPFTLTPGTHVLSATPYQGSNAGRLGGVPLTIRFTVV